jgi:hypothetical protein
MLPRFLSFCIKLVWQFSQMGKKEYAMSQGHYIRIFSSNFDFRTLAPFVHIDVFLFQL